MSRNLFAPPRFKVQMSGALGWTDIKHRVVRYETTPYDTRKEAEQAARELNPGEYTQGRIRVVPMELAEDYDVYPVPERTRENPKSAS
jgi:hypothetical protein